jgi:hypothetical protein
MSSTSLSFPVQNPTPGSAGDTFASILTFCRADVVSSRYYHSRVAATEIRLPRNNAGNPPISALLVTADAKEFR